MRPSFEEIKTEKDFIKWYWLKSELVEICVKLGLPKNGSKFQIRDRIAHYLSTGEALTIPIAKKQSAFNWAQADLTLDTVITDSVTFGPNFRRFMTQRIGKRFSCTSEFMDWVKCNTGKTLNDAIAYWEYLEKRKKDSFFKREIASHNMYNQYIRDYFYENPESTLKQAQASWMQAKQKSSEDGFIKYVKSRNGE